MSVYVNVGVSRIQEYLTRTSGADDRQLRRRRGASRMVSAATDPRAFTGCGLERNDEAYHVEGVVHLRAADETTAGQVLAERALRQVRRALPQAYLSASWTDAGTYSAAYPLLKRARAGDLVDARTGALEWIPPLREDPFGDRCSGCGLAAALAERLCEDCRARDVHGGNVRGGSSAQTPEYRAVAAVSALAGRDLQPVRDLTQLARLVSHVPGAKHNHLATVYADGNGMGRLFDGVSDRELAKQLSTDVDEAIRGAGADALHDVWQSCRGKHFPAVVTVLAADDALVTVPAPLAWTFTRVLIAGFAARMAASNVAGSLRDDDGPVPRPSLTAGIAFSQVKSPIESSIRAAAAAMKAAKRAFPGEAAIGWADLTHPLADTTRPVTAGWLDQHRDLVDAFAGLPGSARAGWERIVLDAARAGVDDARLSRFLRVDFERLGHHWLRDAVTDRRQLATLIDVSRWWSPPTTAGAGAGAGAATQAPVA